MDMLMDLIDANLNPAPAPWQNMLGQLLGTNEQQLPPVARVSATKVTMADDSPSVDDLFFKVFGF